jgi:hypothetical protein
MSFSWSFSQLQSSETCPRRYNEVDLLKNYRDEDRTALDWGSAVHKAFARALLNEDIPLPAEMSPWAHWVDEFKESPGQIIVEAKWALDRNFNKCAWSAPVAWYRGVADATRVDGPVADGVDWKTGGIKEDETQLLLMAQLVFAHFPEVKRCRQRFVWLKHDCATTRTYNRSDMAQQWLGILQRVKTLEGMKETKTFPPRPSGLCREYCPVTSCEFHGKSFH